MTEAQYLETIIRIFMFDHAVIAILGTILFIRWLTPKWWSKDV